VQLLTPLVINVTCEGGPCTTFPLLPSFFDDNMVLQRAPASAALYGASGAPGEIVTVSLGHAEQDDGEAVANGVTGVAAGGARRGVFARKGSWSSKVAQNGSWVVVLDPQKASHGWTITVSAGKGATARTHVLKNVCFGDVYRLRSIISQSELWV
jgi:hypothetical protein